jgi:hypothetical protein
MHDDGFDPRPNGELQEQINWLERSYGDEEFDDDDLWSLEED